MDKQSSPPGSFLAAGALIGTGIATLVLLAPSIPARLVESPFSEGLASFDLALDALSVLFGVAMLVCALGLIARGASFVTWSLALVVVNGLFQLAGATLEKMLFGGTAALLVLRLVFAIATGVLCFVPLLAAYLVLERRRYAPGPARVRRAGLVAIEGIAACVLLGAAFIAMASYSRSLAALTEMQARVASAESPAASALGSRAPSAAGHAAAATPAPAARSLPDPPADPGPGAPNDEGAAQAQALFRRPLASVSGADRPVWEKGASVTLVDFWASWCGPCLYELPRIQGIHDKFSGNGVKVVLVNVDLDEPEPVGRFLTGRAISLNSLVDRGGATFQELGLNALPSLFLLDAQGRPVRSYVGAVDQHSLEHEILTILQGGANARSQNG